ncbi:MAG: hypothetical protein KDA21_13500 [Phycisphaerales bacterium]|nr:hypothetical protein [Phycisphaerales bacterium]
MTMRRLTMLGLAFGVMLSAGCRPPFAGARVDALGAAEAVVASDGSSAGAAALVASCAAGNTDFWAAKDRAHELLDEQDPLAADFALAVLEAGRQMESTLETGDANEFAWWTVGRLAYHAGEAKAMAGDYPGAEAVMLAGPRRWQRDSYWRKYADHDALIAVVLVNLGRRTEAIKWLDQRPVLMPPADEVWEMLTGEAR